MKSIKALLVGLEYNGTNSYLPSTSHDLVCAVKWCNTMGCTDITIITDITILDPDYVDIFNNNNIIRITDIFTMNYALKKAVSSPHCNQHGIFYYTGHGEKEGIQLPDNDIMDNTILRNYVAKLATNVFCIIDCCYFDGWKLPFTYSIEQDRFILNDNYDCLTNNLMVISMSTDRGESLSNTNCSIFSKRIFSLLYRMKDNPKMLALSVFCDKLIEHSTKQTKENHNVSICSSYKCLPILWSWLLFDYDINILTELEAVTIKHVGQGKIIIK